MRLNPISIAAVIVIWCPCAFAQEDRSAYNSAAQASRSGDLDSAFMYYNAIVERYPGSPYYEAALFAGGEYYFLRGAAAEAARAFSRFVREYPDSKGRPFALVYLYKLAQHLALRPQGRGLASDKPKPSDGQVRAGAQDKKMDEAARNLKREIVALQQFSLLFRTYKKLTFISPLSRRHTMTYYIDNVECVVDGEPFAQIAY